MNDQMTMDHVCDVFKAYMDMLRQASRLAEAAHAGFSNLSYSADENGVDVQTLDHLIDAYREARWVTYHIDLGITALTGIRNTLESIGDKNDDQGTV